MVEFGEFEAGGPLHIGPRTTVFRARKRGEGTEWDAVLKVYENPHPEEGEVDFLFDEFLSSIQFHKELGVKLPDVCLACLGAGKKERRAWIAMPYEAFSLERVFDARIPTDAPLIYQYVQELLTALKKIVDTTGRGHGNLKPGNIFLTGEGPLENLNLRLADFAPGAKSRADKEYVQADLVAVGQLLYRLVTRQESKAAAVSDKGEWAIFGKQGPSWMAFCENLLKADAEDSQYTLEKALEQLPNLKPQKAKPWGVLGAAAAVLAVGGILIAHFMMPDGLFGLFLPPPPVTEETQANWEALVREYMEWGEPVDESLKDALSAGSGTSWHQDPYLFNQVLNFYDSNLEAPQVEMDPWEVVERRVPWQTLGESVPEILGRQRYVIRTEQSLLFIRFLRERLEAWPTLDRLDRLVNTYRSRGWDAPAGELMEMRSRYRVDRETPRRVNEVLEGIRLSAQVDRFWGQIQDNVEVLVEEGARSAGEKNLRDPLLLNLPELVLEYGGEVENLKTLTGRISAMNEEIEAMREVVESPVYREETHIALFREESFLSAWDGAVSPGLFRQWLAALPTYRYLQPEMIPLDPVQWESDAAEAGEIMEKMMDLDELIRRTSGDSPLTPSAFQGYQDELAQLNDLGEEATGLPKVFKYRERMEALNNRIVRGFDEFLGRLREMLFQLRPDPDEWLRDINERTIPGSMALNRIWTQRRDALLDETPRDIWENDDEVFSRLRADIEAQRSFLAGLASEEVVPGPRLDQTTISDTLFPVLQDRIERERESTLELLAELMPENPENIRVRDFMEQPAAASTREEYVLLKEQAQEIGGSFEPARRALASGEGLEETPDAFYSKWEDHPVFRDLLSLEPVAEFSSGMETLRDLRGRDDISTGELLERIGNNDTFLAERIEAYRKLGQVATWPVSADDFRRDHEALTRLLEITEEAVENRLHGLSQTRWRRRLSEAESVEELDSVFEYLPQYGIEASALSGEDRYRYFLYREWENLSAIPDLRYAEGDVIERLKQELLRRLSGIERIADLSPAVALADELRAFNPLEEKPPPPPTELGPALAGWEFLSGRSNQDRYTYEIDDALFGRQQLTFHRLENPEGGSYWITDIVVSTAIFRMVLDIEGAWPEWQEYNSDRDMAYSVDDRTGPRTWEFIGGVMEEPPDGWLFPAPGWDTVGQIYAREPMGRGPGGDYPMNYVPAPLALEFAGFLSCSLPTPAVWEMMMKAFPNTNPGNDNIRDATWLEQLEYVETSFTSFHPWPDADGFARSLVPEAGTENDAEPVNPDYDDETLWFNEVRSQGENAGGDIIHHLYGNVAEYLFDGNQYYIAGRSAISPPEVDAGGMIPVPELYELTGFPDVGFRLMFEIDRISPGLELMRRLRERYAATLPSSTPTTAALLHF